MIQPNPMLVQLSAADLREIVRSELAEILADREAVASKPALLDAQGLAKKLDVSPSQISQMLKQGLPHILVGAARRFDFSTVVAWCAAQKAEREAE